MARAGSVHEYLIELHEKYGEIVGFWWGKEYAVSLSSIEYWKEIQPIFDKPCKMQSYTNSNTQYMCTQYSHVLIWHA